MKAQITIFIILGMIILGLLAFGMMYFVSEDATPAQPKTDGVSNYVISCLQAASTDALRTFGSHGAISVDDGGSQELDAANSVVNNGVIYAAYIVADPVFVIAGPPDISNAPINPTYLSPDHYPFTGFPYLGTTRVFKLPAAFGWPNVPQTNATAANSIEESLNRYVNKAMSACDLSVLAQQGVRATAQGDPDVRTLFTDSGVDFLLTWPLEVTDISGTATLSSFSQHHDAHLKQIMERVRLMIDAETTDIAYNISQQSGIFLTRLPDNQALVSVIDPLSRIGGKLYNLTFGIMNRAPVLYSIDKHRGLLEEPAYRFSQCEARLVGTEEALSVSGGACDIALDLSIHVQDPDEWQRAIVQYSPQNFAGNPLVMAPPGVFDYTLTAQDTDPDAMPCLHLLVEAFDGRRNDGELLTLYNEEVQQCS